MAPPASRRHLLLLGSIVVSSLLVSTTLAFTILPTTSTKTFSYSEKTHLKMTTSTKTESTTVVSTTTHPCAVVENPPMTKTAKAVIFDIDGTLANSWKLGYDATVVVLENNKDTLGDVVINEQIYHETCVYATPERLARTAGYVPGDEQFESIGQELGKQFDDYYVKLVSLETCEFYDGIMDILQNLPSNVKLGALTNACVAYGYAVLQVNCPIKSKSSSDEEEKKDGGLFALYDRFGTIHGADSVPASKPNPDGLLQCAKELGLNPEDCIYVGDAIGDGKAARAAGMISIGVLWGSNSKEKLLSANTFDYLCSTRDELRDLLPQN